MVAMNLRGVKESVLALVPVFLAFVGLHLVLICYAFLSRAVELPVIAHDAVRQANSQELLPFLSDGTLSAPAN